MSEEPVVTPLHDHPLVPGDEVRKLRAELESTTQVLRDTVAAYERLMEESDAAEDQARREGFEAGQREKWDENEEKWQPIYETFEDYERERKA